MATQEEIKNIFPAMMENFQPDKAEGVDTTIQFDLSGDNGGLYWLKIDNGDVTYGEGDVAAETTVKANADDFYAISTGNMNAMQAFMMGKIKIDNMGMGMKMLSMFNMS